MTSIRGVISDCGVVDRERRAFYLCRCRTVLTHAGFSKPADIFLTGEGAVEQVWPKIGKF